ncbi:LysR family transcriptional regulator [Planctobacterium marinum]|uniref:LysR family transcriptional regulator n=1 Tax=Planctobacterium marinum TaxID=1631968 RepID=A0AA48HIV4_9ALTE|nr:LysR family transcriptional regulator [Planctobacterium marinum]
MDLNDLRYFLTVARSNNLQVAAKELNKTPGALSKAIRRIEALTNTQLFERQGRNIRLNLQGERFCDYARVIVHESEQAISAFGQGQHKTLVNISGPVVLLHYLLPEVLDCLPDHQFQVHIAAQWEGEALKQVSDGSAHFAIVTAEAIASGNADIAKIDLGETEFAVMAGPAHPLLQQNRNNILSHESILQYPFACPAVSPFCGIKRGIGSDGWRDDVLSREIAYRCDDFSTLLMLVQQGRALAYMPDLCAASGILERLNVCQLPWHYREKLCLVYKPSKASGWLNRFVSELQIQLSRA